MARTKQTARKFTHRINPSFRTKLVLMQASPSRTGKSTGGKAPRKQVVNNKPLVTKHVARKHAQSGGYVISSLLFLPFTRFVWTRLLTHVL